MRQWVAAIAALGLAGCGGANTKDFTIAVKGDVASVKANLAGLAVMSASTAGISPAKVDSGDGVLTYTIPSEEGWDPSEIKLTFAQNGARTMIDVAVDVPRVTQGGNQYLAEDKVEKALEEEFRAWAKRYDTVGSLASTKTLELTFVTLAVAAQRVDPENVNLAFDFGSGGESQAGGWAGSEYAYDDPSDGGWGSDTEVSYDEDGWGTGS